MRGEPRYGGWKRWIGPRSPLYGIFWATVCPILAVVIAVLQLRRSIPFSIKMDDSRIYVFPVLAEIFGWFLDLGALIPIPAFFIYKWIQYRKRGIVCFLHFPLKSSFSPSTTSSVHLKIFPLMIGTTRTTRCQIQKKWPFVAPP